MQTETLSQIEFMQAQITDSASIIAHFQRVAPESDFLSFGEGEFNMTVEEEEKFIAAVNASKHDLFLLAKDRGVIIGSLTLIAPRRPRLLHCTELGIVVSKSHWGQGVGRRLMEKGIAWAKEQGTIRKIALKVRTDNQKGVKLYESLGFVIEGELQKDNYCNGRYYNTYVMGLMLD